MRSCVFFYCFFLLFFLFQIFSALFFVRREKPNWIEVWNNTMIFCSLFETIFGLLNSRGIKSIDEWICVLEQSAQKRKTRALSALEAFVKWTKTQKSQSSRSECERSRIKIKRNRKKQAATLTDCSSSHCNRRCRRLRHRSISTDSMKFFVRKLDLETNRRPPDRLNVSERDECATIFSLM